MSKRNAYYSQVRKVHKVLNTDKKCYRGNDAMTNIYIVELH